MRHLRSSAAFSGLPLVAVTAYGLPGDRERFLAAGFDAYLTKPFGRNDLRDAIAAAIATRTPSLAAPGGGTFVSRPVEKPPGSMAPRPPVLDSTP